MKRFLLSIAFLFTVCAVSAQKNESVIECLEILFSKDRFDTVFYKHKPHENITCFFAFKNSTTDNFFNVPDFKGAPYKLKNGNQFSIAPGIDLWVWGIDYFVKFINFSITNEKITLVFQEINNNGFKEKVLRTREVVFVKKEGWQLMKEKSW